MAANQFGIDLGSLYRTTEAVKGARTQNRLSQLQLDETEREIAERPAKEAAEKKRKNLIAQNITGALSGDEGALNQLYVLDMDSAKEIASRIGSMSEKEKKQAEANQLELGKMAYWVDQSETPEQASERLDVALSQLPEEMRTQALDELEQLGGDPKKYAQYTLAKLSDVKTIFSDPKVIQVGGEDVVYKAGREVERKTRPVKTSGTGSDGGGVKSADESLMYRQAAERMGGMFDDAGNLTAIDPTVRPKVQAIAARASEIFKQGGVTRSRAVSMAHDEVVGADNGQPPQPSYPEGTRIRNPSTGAIMIMRGGQWVSQ